MAPMENTPSRPRIMSASSTLIARSPLSSTDHRGPCVTKYTVASAVATAAVAASTTALARARRRTATFGATTTPRNVSAATSPGASGYAYQPKYVHPLSVFTRKKTPAKTSASPPAKTPSGFATRADR